jgi:F0F1-type ATP synthase membrane subunit b/b'
MSSETTGMLLAQADAAQGEMHTETSVPAEHKAPSLLQFDPGVWVWSVLVFAVLLIILKKMAWKPMIAAIDAREKTIKDSLDQAANIQAEAKRIGEEQNKILAEARIQAQALLQSSKQVGEELRKKLEQAAQGRRRAYWLRPPGK